MPDSKTISPSALRHRLAKQESLLLLDVLPEDTFAQRHLPGAQNTCVYEMGFIDKVRDLLSANASMPIVLYGESEPSGACEEAAQRLHAAGYDDVTILAGGVSAWNREGLPTEGHGRPDPTVPDVTAPIDSSASLIEWVGRNIGNKHWGTLRFAEGSLSFKNALPVKGRLVIDMASISCADITDPALNALLVAHLKSSDFFMVEKFPQAVLEIGNAKRIPETRAGLPNTRLNSTLTLRGTSQGLEVDALLGLSSAGDFVAQAWFEIDRTRWNIRYGSGKFFERLGKHLVNDLVGIQLKIVVSQQSLAQDSAG